MERLHMRDFVEDRTKDRWKSLLVLYTSGTPGKLQTCPSSTTDGKRACGWERAWRQTSTKWGLQQEFAGVDPSGGAQRNNAGTGRC